MASAHSGDTGVTTQHSAAPSELAWARISFLSLMVTSEVAAGPLWQQVVVLATSSILYSFLLSKGGPLELSERTLEYLRHPHGGWQVQQGCGRAL